MKQSSILPILVVIAASVLCPAVAQPEGDKQAAESQAVPAEKIISKEALSNYKTITVTVEEDGKTATYKGVPVRAILAEAIPAIDSMPEWKNLARRELILKFTADDGFPALIAATEVATNKAGDRFLLATERDGQPIEGGIRLICPKDEHHVRWARRIKSLKFISLQKQ